VAFTNKAEKGAVQRGTGAATADNLAEKGAVQSGAAAGGPETKTGSFTGDAALGRTRTGTVAADAGLLAALAKTISANAGISRIGKPIWVSPADGVDMERKPVLVFQMPNSVGNMHFHMQLDTVDTFDGGDLRELKTNQDLTGWEYYDGDSWEPFPAAGVANTYAGNNARYTPQTDLSLDIWYRRVRAGVSDWTGLLLQNGEPFLLQTGQPLELQHGG